MEVHTQVCARLTDPKRHRALRIVFVVVALLLATYTWEVRSKDLPATSAELRRAIGCVGWDVQAGVQAAQESGYCRLRGKLVTVTIYANSRQQTAMKQINALLNGRLIVTGYLWDIATQDATAAREIARATGGRVLGDGNHVLPA